MKKISGTSIEIPEGIQFEFEGRTLKMSNGKEEIKKEFKAKGIEFQKKENSIIIKSNSSSRKAKSLINAIESHINNLVTGLKKGYEYKLAIVYSHFPINVAVKGNFVEINNFAGEKKPRKAVIAGKAKVEVKGKDIIVTGTMKEEVGQTAANLEKATRIKGKDRRIFQDGIYITGRRAIE